MTTLMGIVLTAIFSSLLTLIAAWIAYRLWGERRLDAQLVLIQAQFEQRVKSGVLAAGRELLPEFRREVAAGFEDAMKKSQAAGLAEDAAKVVTGAAGIAGDAAKVVTGAAGMLESGLSSLFGLTKK